MFVENCVKLKTRICSLALGLVLGCWTPGWAETATVAHNVTVVVVQPTLSITEDTGDFTLTFEDYTDGTRTNDQQVVYRVMGNNLPSDVLAGVVSAKVDSSIQGVQMQADVGSYANLGSSGNIQLQEAQSGYVPIQNDWVELADKSVTTGAQSTVMNGTISVRWRAEATQDLPAGSYGTALTVTIKDS